MSIIYTSAVKAARMAAVNTAIGTAGYIELGTASMASVLATIPLANPAGTVSGGVFTLTMPQSDTSADASGTAVEARIRNASDTDIITGLTVAISGADINIDNNVLAVTQTVTLSSGAITHA